MVELQKERFKFLNQLLGLHAIKITTKDWDNGRKHKANIYFKNRRFCSIGLDSYEDYLKLAELISETVSYAYSIEDEEM